MSTSFAAYGNEFRLVAWVFLLKIKQDAFFYDLNQELNEQMLCT
jgi:hypothetical protein